MRKNKKRPTNHSLWPWKPSGLSFLTATTIPLPGFAAENVCSSIHPLKTQPNPPSPRRLSGRKFLVAFFSSLNEKAFIFGEDKISPSDLGVGRLEALLFPLKEDGMVRLEGANERLVLLEVFETPNPSWRRKSLLEN
jgi:hypothetical protein